jgi:hypothetical protein
MFVPWEEWLKDDARREATMKAVLARALYWFMLAQREIESAPASPLWLESLAECCASIEDLFPDAETNERIHISATLLDALTDLRNGLVPDWMNPVNFPPSRRPPSHKVQAIRGLMVDSVRGLHELFDMGEREACKAVSNRLRTRTNASAEALRGWVRSGLYDKFGDLVYAVGEYDGKTSREWLNATTRAYDRLARYPGAKPSTQARKAG